MASPVTNPARTRSSVTSRTCHTPSSATRPMSCTRSLASRSRPRAPYAASSSSRRLPETTPPPLHTREKSCARQRPPRRCLSRLPKRLLVSTMRSRRRMVVGKRMLCVMIRCRMPGSPVRGRLNYFSCFPLLLSVYIRSSSARDWVVAIVGNCLFALVYLSYPSTSLVYIHSSSGHQQSLDHGN